ILWRIRQIPLWWWIPLITRWWIVRMVSHSFKPSTRKQKHAEPVYPFPKDFTQQSNTLMTGNVAGSVTGDPVDAVLALDFAKGRTHPAHSSLFGREKEREYRRLIVVPCQ